MIWITSKAELMHINYDLLKLNTTDSRLGDTAILNFVIKLAVGKSLRQTLDHVCKQLLSSGRQIWVFQCRYRYLESRAIDRSTSTT